MLTTWPSVLQVACAHQKTGALLAALDIELFDAIGDGRTAIDIATRCGAPEPAVRILCDYLVAIRLLQRQGTEYRNTCESSMYLRRTAPTYIGELLHSLAHPNTVRLFGMLATTMRGDAVPVDASADDEIWSGSARGMAVAMEPAAQALAERIPVAPGAAPRILELGAGHAAFGIALAQKHAGASVVAVDSAAVLRVACENAMRKQVASRFSAIAGDVRHIDFGGTYDVVLVTNLLHLFDPNTCTHLTRRAVAHLNARGVLVIVDVMRSETGPSHPFESSLELLLLATTPGAQLYTERELCELLCASGLAQIESHPLPTGHAALLATR